MLCVMYICTWSSVHNYMDIQNFIGYGTYPQLLVTYLHIMNNDIIMQLYQHAKVTPSCPAVASPWCQRLLTFAC